MTIAERRQTRQRTTHPNGVAPRQSEKIPPLENGDRLTRAEFERRYDAMPHLKKAELIDGRVYMPSPVKHKRHSRPHFLAIAWLSQYFLATPGLDSGDNGSLRIDEDNMPQPDVVLFIPEELGGSTHITEDDYLEGSPELVVEIAASTVSYDMNEKFDTYRRIGVQEYLVWRVDEREIDWFALVEGRYVPLPRDEDGILRSRVFPGLWLAADALVDEEMATVLAVQLEGLQSEAHAAFFAGLAAKNSEASQAATNAE